MFETYLRIVKMETEIVRGLDTVSTLEGEPNLYDLPWEVLQEIFCHLDGKSLLICKRVCRRWKEHVHHLEQKTNFWFNNCKKEIPSWAQFDLMDNLFPSHWKAQGQVDWEEIFKCWTVWNSSFETPVTVQKIVSGINGISKIKVSGECLLIGTCEGRGKLCAQWLTGASDLVDLYVGGGAILDFELVISDRHPYCNVRPTAKLDEIFQTLKHNEIWLELKDCYIQLGKNYCHMVDKTQQKISHSYGYEARLVKDRHGSSVILKKTCSKVNGPELVDLELSRPYTHILEFWISNLSLCDIKCDKQLFIDAVSVNPRTMQTSLTSTFGHCRDGETSTVYSWHGSLFVVYTNKRSLIIHYKDKEAIQVTPVKKGRVTSVLFYCNHLFLGTDRGKLLVYKVTSPEDCLNITVYETACSEVEVCWGKIVHLTVAEPIHHKGRGPVVLCATPEAVYSVSI